MDADLGNKIKCCSGRSLVIEEDAYFYNRFIMVTPTEEVMYYDKRHTFTLAGEHKAYRAGENEGIFDYEGWKICLRICYDLKGSQYGLEIRKTTIYFFMLLTGPSLESTHGTPC